ncbi:MAG: hypothetical protein IT423_00805 [Pirellulaceae bacterium]|nr:hypothetical protein [Pirellulaceae bacterium]
MTHGQGRLGRKQRLLVTLLLTNLRALAQMISDECQVSKVTHVVYGRVRGLATFAYEASLIILSSANPVGARLVDSRNTSIEICAPAFEAIHEIPIFLKFGGSLTAQNRPKRRNRYFFTHPQS